MGDVHRPHPRSFRVLGRLGARRPQTKAVSDLVALRGRNRGRVNARCQAGDGGVLCSLRAGADEHVVASNLYVPFSRFAAKITESYPLDRRVFRRGELCRGANLEGRG
jgi:hypothetical protein